MEDDLVNLQKLIDEVKRLEGKGFHNAELKESLSEGLSDDFKFDIYNALASVAQKYEINRGHNLTPEEFKEAFDWFMLKFFEE